MISDRLMMPKCFGRFAARRGDCLTSDGRRSLQLLEAASSLVQCGVSLAEAEAHLLAAKGRIAVEAAAGNRSHTDLLDKVSGEAHVIRKSERGDIRHYIVGASRLEAPEAGLFQKGQYAVAS